MGAGAAGNVTVYRIPTGCVFFMEAGAVLHAGNVTVCRLSGSGATPRSFFKFITNISHIFITHSHIPMCGACSYMIRESVSAICFYSPLIAICSHMMLAWSPAGNVVCMDPDP